MSTYNAAIWRVRVTMRQCVSFAMLSSYEIFRTAVKNMGKFGLHVKCPLLSPDFNPSPELLYRFSQKSPTSNFTKIRPVGDELIHADIRTDTTTEITCFFFRECC